MTANKPEVFRFHCYGQSAPAYNCNKPADNSGEYVRLAEYEALQAECEKLRKDSELYRGLRAMHWHDSPLAVVRNPKKAVRPGYDCPSEERLDAAIDDAMQRREHKLTDDDGEPYCEDCAIGAGLIEGDHAN